MATAQMGTVIRHLRRAVLRQDARTDGQLLASFIDKKDESAFEALVHRRGSMVFGICRRVIGNHHDAEDAFQATFLVLAYKAASIKPQDRVVNWLHGVALRTAMTAKRRVREKQVTEMPEPHTVRHDQWHDLQPLLNQELNGLPENYRLAILLCDLEGKTIKEATQQLGWPQGTLATRLARGRKLLAKRLTHRGVVLSAGSLVAVVSRNVASAAVPTSVVSATIKAASLYAAGRAAATGAISIKVIALTKGVLNSMLLSKFRFAIFAVLVIASVGIGAGVFAWRGQASEPPVRKDRTPKGKDEALKKKLLELDELWWKGDVATLDKLAAEDLITVSAVGRYDKASLLAASKHRHAVDWVKRDVEVSRISKDVAIVTYRYDCKIVLSDGRPLETYRDRRVSMTWVNRQGDWVVAFVQETVLPGGK